MQLPPLSVLESWPPRNTVNPASRGNAHVIIQLIFMPILLVFLAIRLYTRYYISKYIGLDDYLILAGLVSRTHSQIFLYTNRLFQIPAMIYVAVALVADRHLRLSRHIWDIETSNVIIHLKLVIVVEVAFAVAQSFTKCSLLAMTYRILAFKGRYAQVIIVAAVVVLAQTGIFITIAIFTCRYGFIPHSPTSLEI